MMGDRHPIVIHSSGVLTDPPIHDGYLESIRSTDGVLELGILDADKLNRYVLVFPGVRNLACNAFLAGNIVFGIEYCVTEDDPGVPGNFVSGLPEHLLETYDLYYGWDKNPTGWLSLGSSYGAVLLASGDLRVAEFHYFRTEA